MFGFLKDRRLLEQKKMLWQNFHGSKDIKERLLKRIEAGGMSQGRREVMERTIERLEMIRTLSGNAINAWNFKQPLDGDALSYTWNNNKMLRQIYSEHFGEGGFGPRTFDDFIDPPYGWDVALKDWN